MKAIDLCARVSCFVARLLLCVATGAVFSAEQLQPLSNAVPESRPRLSVNRGHVRTIQSLSVSRDGNLLATASREAKEVCIWDATSGRELRCFETSAPVLSVDLTIDGYLVGLVESGFRVDVRIWDLSTLKPVDLRDISRILASAMQIVAVAVHSNGRMLLGSEVGDSVALFDLHLCCELRYFDQFVYPPGGRSKISIASAINDLAFSDDGRYAVGGGSRYGQGTVTVWEVDTGRVLSTFVAETNSNINRVRFSREPNAQYLITEANSGTIRVWQWRGQNLMYSLEGGYVAFDVSRDGGYLLTGKIGVRDVAALWDLKTGTPLRSFSGHDNATIVSAASISLDGRYAYTADISGDAVKWEVNSATELRRFSGHAIEDVNALTFANSDRTLVAGGGRQFKVPAALPFMIVGLGGRDAAYSWNLEDGREFNRTPVRRGAINSLATSRDGHRLVIGRIDHVELLEIDTNKSIWSWTPDTEKGEQVSSVSYCTGRDGAILAVGGTNLHPRYWYLDRRNADPVILTNATRLATGWRSTVALSGQCDVLAVGYGQVELDPTKKVPRGECGEIVAWDIRNLRKMDPIEGAEGANIVALAISTNGKYLVAGRETGDLEVWSTSDGRRLWQQRDFQEVSSVSIAGNGEFVLAGGQIEDSPKWVDGLWTPSARHSVAIRFRTVDGIRAGMLALNESDIQAVAFSTDGRMAATAGSTRMTRIWNAEKGEEIARLVSFVDGTWLVAAADGRFDTNNLEEIKGVQWAVPDDPLHPLPVEIFMRDYYEPRLLPRLLAGEILPPIRSLASLNRVQPAIEIVDIKREGGSRASGDTVAVTVQVATVAAARNGQQPRSESDAYDLRLFRDGQLIGQWPAQVAETPLEKPTVDDLARWRKESLVVGQKKDGRRIVFKGVRLPRLTGVKELRFTAYAFNKDRVKSVTAVKYYSMPYDLAPRRPRAYIVSIGVNRFEDPTWDLSYAVNDAKQFRRVLKDRLEALKEPDGTNSYERVVPIVLASEGEALAKGKKATQATKRQIEAVVKALSGQPVDTAVLASVEGGRELRRANPEDLVIISISTHGIVEGGQFYLIPADTGGGFSLSTARDQSEKARILRRAVSSDDLSRWLYGLDARDQVMIVDACHSAASVGEAFKPGPMGSRGLGQLAYDQGMRILTATQVREWAFETKEAKHGLLSYALLHDGLERNEADYKPRDGRISVSEWLGYAVVRVPQLYRSWAKGEPIDSGRTVVTVRGEPFSMMPSQPGATNRESLQTPGLFDFAKGSDIWMSRQPMQ